MEEYKGFKIPNTNDIRKEMNERGISLKVVNPNVRRYIDLYRWIDLIKIPTNIDVNEVLALDEEEANNTILTRSKQYIDEWELEHGEEIRKKNEEIEKRNLHEYLT